MNNLVTSFNRPIEDVLASQGITNRPVRIDDSCIIQINNRFFLIVLIRFDNIERAVVIRISRAQAEALVRSGVRQCQVVDVLPTNVQRTAVELLCVFVVDNQAFLVFETEGAVERLIIARIPLCFIENRDF